MWILSNVTGSHSRGWQKGTGGTHGAVQLIAGAGQQQGGQITAQQLASLLAGITPAAQAAAAQPAGAAAAGDSGPNMTAPLPGNWKGLGAWPAVMPAEAPGVGMPYAGAAAASGSGPKPENKEPDSCCCGCCSCLGIKCPCPGGGGRVKGCDTAPNSAVAALPAMGTKP